MIQGLKERYLRRRACQYTGLQKPEDKTKVKKGVQDVERRILAPLRHRTFFSLGELNEAIPEMLIQYDGRPFQKLPGSRLTLFEPSFAFILTHCCH